MSEVLEKKIDFSLNIKLKIFLLMNGKKRNRASEAEMPGLMALREEYKERNL